MHPVFGQGDHSVKALLSHYAEMTVSLARTSAGGWQSAGNLERRSWRHAVASGGIEAETDRVFTY